MLFDFFYNFCLKHFSSQKELWDIIINVHRHSCDLTVMYKGIRVKYQLFLSHFNETWIFSTDKKMLKYQISWKPIQWEPSLFHAKGEMDRGDETSSHFLQLCECACRFHVFTAVTIHTVVVCIMTLLQSPTTFHSITTQQNATWINHVGMESNYHWQH
jgi:hypothetical protein